VSEVLDWFARRLADREIDSTSAAVLARGNKLVREINGEAGSDIRPRLRAIGKAVAIVRSGGTLTRQQAEAVDRVVSSVAWNVDNLADLDGERRDQVRRVASTLIQTVPELRGDLRRWAPQVARAVAAATQGLVEAPARQPGHLIRAEAAYAGVETSEAFAERRHDLLAQTVHDLKGESRDAVLVVAGAAAGGRRTPQGELWSLPLGGNDIPEEQAEELRIVFVALTRAARLCVVALPSDTPQDVIQRFIDSGFLLVE
jgi:hypothetical protein